MSLALVVQWIVISLLAVLSLREIWQRVIRPAFQRPKAGCGDGSCDGCAPKK